MKNYNEYKKEIARLKKLIKRLEDENESLWFLLDEFEKSNIRNPEYAEKFTEAFSKLRMQNLMTSNKVEEA